MTVDESSQLSKISNFRHPKTLFHILQTVARLEHAGKIHRRSSGAIAIKGTTCIHVYREMQYCLGLHCPPPLTIKCIYTVSQKTRQVSCFLTHVDNFTKNLSIFKTLSLIDSKQNFLQNKYCIAHYTLQMLLNYLVKLQCFKNRTNSKIHYRRTLF